MGIWKVWNPDRSLPLLRKGRRTELSNNIIKKTYGHVTGAAVVRVAGWLTRTQTFSRYFLPSAKLL